MKRISLQSWLGTGFLILGLGSGCNYGGMRPTAQRPEQGRVALLRHAPPKPASLQAVVQPEMALAATPVQGSGSESLRWMPVAESPASPPSEKLATENNPAEESSSVTADVIPAAATADREESTSRKTLQEEATAGSLTPARKSFTDVTAHPCFSHASDYSWLCGQIQHSRLTKGWRLRYASVDEVDPYGGSVTLVDEARLSGLSDGQYVRVEGRFVNAPEQGIAPPYQVDSVQPIAKPD